MTNQNHEIPLTLTQFLADGSPAAEPKDGVFTPCTTITPREYGSVLVTEDNAFAVAAAIGSGAWVDRDRHTHAITGVSYRSDGRIRRAAVGEYIVTGEEYGLTLYQTYTADEYADTYTPAEDDDPAALRAELKAVRAELATVTEQYKRARYDRNRYWDGRNTARERADRLDAQMKGLPYPSE